MATPSTGARPPATPTSRAGLGATGASNSADKARGPGSKLSAAERAARRASTGALPQRKQPASSPLASPASSAAGGEPGNVRVVARFRPLNTRELDMGSAPCVQFDDNGATVYIQSEDAQALPAAASGAWGAAADDGQAMHGKPFHFDAVYGPDSTQQGVFAGAAEPVLEGLFEGYNASILAYGQTGTCGDPATRAGPPLLARGTAATPLPPQALARRTA